MEGLDSGRPHASPEKAVGELFGARSTGLRAKSTSRAFPLGQTHGVVLSSAGGSTPQVRAMTTPTTIKAVDRVLEQHGPFPSTEAAEALAAQLLATWRVLHPSSEVDNTVSRMRQTHRR